MSGRVSKSALEPTRAQFRGLLSRPELNGRMCRVLQQLGVGGRWKVRLDGETWNETLAVKAENLFAVSDDGAALPPLGSKFRLQEVPGSGLGVVALTALQPGERLLAEKPLFRICAQEMLAARSAGRESEEQMIRKELDALCDVEQQAFWTLSDCHSGPGAKSTFGIWQTNAIATGEDSGESENCLYLVGCRFNHSCKPNVNRCWIPEMGVEVFHAIQEVAPGEELSIYYVDPMSVRAERQAVLQHAFNFTCQCEVCSLQGASFAESDRLRSEYKELDAKLDSAIRGPNDPLSAMEMIWRMIEIIEDEFDGDPHLMQKSFYDGFVVSVMMETGGLESEEGHEDWLAMAFKAKVLAEGEHAQALQLKAWAENPTQHPLVARAAASRRSRHASSFVAAVDTESMYCQPCGVPFDNKFSNEEQTQAEKRMAMLDLASMD